MNITEVLDCTAANEEFQIVFALRDDGKTGAVLVSDGGMAPAGLIEESATKRVLRALPGDAGSLPIVLITLNADLSALVSFGNGTGHVTHGGMCSARDLP